MYRINDYDEAVSSCICKLKKQTCSKSKLHSFKYSAREFKNHLIANNREYSLNSVAEWLKQYKKEWTHAKFISNRCAQLEIAAKVFSGFPVKQFLYTDLPNYQRLNEWAKVLLDAFLLQQQGRIKFKTGEQARINCSNFLIWLDEHGVSGTNQITHQLVINYCLEAGVNQGVKHFLQYLAQLKLVPYFLPEAYNSFFAKRIIYVHQLELSEFQLHQPRSSRHTSVQFVLAAQRVTEKLIGMNYAESPLKTLKTTWDEFGLFMEVNRLGYSKDLVEKWIECLHIKTGLFLAERLRSLKLVGEMLEHPELCKFPPKYSLPTNLFPDWAQPLFCEYLDERKSEGMGDSTIAMDRSSNLRFLRYLHMQGVRKFEDTTPELIKSFHLQDDHASPAGKNAYNRRIRSFLLFLSRKQLVRSTLALAVSPVCGVKYRPAVILSEKQQQAVMHYCNTAKTNMQLRDCAILRLAVHLGLRSSDIAELPLHAIDWQKQELGFIQRKTQVFIRLPFSVMEGNSLFRYITEVRPKSRCPHVFIQSKAPYGPLSRSGCRDALKRALTVSGAYEPCTFHMLRKTFASKLLHNGISTQLISEVLGHQTDGTIDPYLDTNIEKLKMCSIGIQKLEYTGDQL